MSEESKASIAVDKAVSPVGSAQNSLHEELNILHDTIDKLVSRVEPVYVNQGSSLDAKEPTPETPKSDVRQRTIDAANKVRYARIRIEDVLAGLEI